MAAQLVEALGHALLDDVLEVDDAEDARRRRPPPAACRRRSAMPLDDRVELGGHGAALLLDPARAPSRPRPCGRWPARRGRRRSCGSGR